ARQIETRFMQMNRKVSGQFSAIGRSLAAGFAGGMFAGGVTELAQGVQRLVGEMARMKDVADMIGLGVEELQKLRLAFDLAGVSAEKTDVALRRFSRRIGEAANGSGVLHGVLEANNLQLRNADGTMRP